MKTKTSLSIEENLLETIQNQQRILQEKNPKRCISTSKVICAHVERSLKIPAEVTIQ